MNKFDQEYFKIITESTVVLRNIKPISRKTPSIQEVKTQLLKLFKMKSWNQFVDMQKAGQCDFISKAVCRLFPKFKMVSVFVNFSKDAKQKMQDSENTYATHFLNKLGNNYYDFGKGTNRYNGVYVLEGLGNIYDVVVNDEQKKQFQKQQQEDPKAIGTIIR